jgi:opacity protein-like surface antigen
MSEIPLRQQEKTLTNRSLRFLGYFAVLLFLASPAYAQNAPLGGLYVGAVWGLGTGSLSTADNAIELSPDGHTLGGRIGFNKMTRSWLVGVEADWAKSNIDGKEKFTQSGFTTVFDADHKTLSTVRARVGKQAGNALLYGTGGLAIATVDASVSVTGPLGRVGNLAVDSANHSGWVLGGGLELPISNRLSFTGEYLWVDFQAEELTFDIGVHARPMVEDAYFDMHALRLGVNVRF